MSIKSQIVIGIILFNIAIVHGLTCDEYLEFTQDKKLSKSDLESMQPNDVVQCLLHLGKEQLPPPETEWIWKTIVKFYEGIVNIPDEILAILHWITPAIAPEDYANITLSNIDVVQNFGLNYNLNDAQLSALAARVREDFAAKEPEDYTYYDLTAIRQILCAYNKTEIERIPPSSYREAAILIGKLENCNAEVMFGFATLAVQRRAFGPIEEWTEDTIKLIGKVANYLPKKFVDKFSVNVTTEASIDKVKQGF